MIRTGGNAVGTINATNEMVFMLKHWPMRHQSHPHSHILSLPGSGRAFTNRIHPGQSNTLKAQNTTIPSDPTERKIRSPSTRARNLSRFIRCAFFLFSNPPFLCFFHGVEYHDVNIHCEVRVHRDKRGYKMPAVHVGEFIAHLSSPFASHSRNFSLFRRYSWIRLSPLQISRNLLLAAIHAISANHQKKHNAARTAAMPPIVTKNTPTISTKASIRYPSSGSSGSGIQWVTSTNPNNPLS
nr:MAG TPA: hypothetical protein [Caudoviricetes sp.]